MAPSETEQPGKDGPEIGAAPERDSGADDVERLFRHVAEITSHASRLSRLRMARWEIRATWLVSAVFLGLILTVVAIAAGLAGVSLIARGLPASLTGLLGGHAGVAELVSGLILLGGIGALVLGARAFGERHILRGIEERDDSRPPSA